MPNSEESNTRRSYDILIMEELRSLRKDMRFDMIALREEIKGIHVNCGIKSEDCNKKFITTTTFWRMIALGIVVLVGSYTFTGTVLAFVMRNLTGP